MKTVIKFSAAWCGPCRLMKPIFEKVTKKFEGQEGIEFKEISLDDDDDGEVAEKYGIRNLPTFIIQNNGNEYSRHTGAINEEGLTNWIKNNI